ncbi:unnamed protein product [Trifolium pratense]|uniref:Uncharacterized protein n=1 Tax=Trifolium pratense TaxID=57577 RepID=A0ACB0IXK3_TRIPR|nr:unnamed protein product [Trifolium pratense]
MDLGKNCMHLNTFTSWVPDMKLKNEVEKTCFKYFVQLSNANQIKIPLQMLAALLEFYNTDGEYFKFGDVVLDIGLEDILYITGLPIDGKQVSGVEHKNATATIVEHLSITEAEAKDLLLVTKRDKQSFDIDLGKLRAKFKDSTISDENLASHVKAYLLYLLGEVLLNTPSSNTISYIYLPFLDIDRIDSYAWGAAVLATLKVSMRKLCSGETRTLSGFTYALMVFAFERFACLRNLYGVRTPFGFPLMVGWVEISHAKLRKNTLTNVEIFSEQLSNVKNENVDWCPYKRDGCGLPNELEHQTWMVYAKVYSICFENIAKHPVDVCWRQLGLEKEEVRTDLTKLKDVKLQKRGPKKDKDWRSTKCYKPYNDRWVERNMFLIKEGFSYDGQLVNYEQVLETASPTHHVHHVDDEATEVVTHSEGGSSSRESSPSQSTEPVIEASDDADDTRAPHTIVRYSRLLRELSPVSPPRHAKRQSKRVDPFLFIPIPTTWLCERN